MFGIERFADHAALFGRMAERQGVDWSRAGSVAGDLALRRAIGRCIACRETEACRDLPETSAAPEFCPNAAQFRAWAGGGSGA